MIRYVLAVALTIALVALSIPAIEHGATVQSDRQLERDVAEIDRAATSLVDHEDQTPENHPSPHRAVTVTFPDDSLTSTSVEHFEIERTSANTSVVTVLLDGSSPSTTTIDAPIVHATPMANRSVELGGTGTETELVLRLERDPSGTDVVVASRV